MDNRYTDEISTYEGICYRFAKSIISYAKSSYDNLILGHFDIVSTIDRLLTENIVCMNVILNNVEIGKELWKYYLVYSYKQDILKSKKKITKEDNEFFKKMCKDYGIDENFLKKRKNKKGKEFAYVDLNYGRTYKVNRNFSFKGLCELVKEDDYKIFSMASLYAHGTSLYLKIGSNSNIERVFYLITSIYITLYRMVTMYCWDYVSDEFNDLAEEIESIIYKHIDYCEDLYKDI